MSYTKRTRRCLVAACLASAILATSLPSRVAAAQGAEATQSGGQESQLIAQIEQSTQAYQDATAMVDELATQIADNEQHAQEIEEQLPAQRERAAASIKRLYVFHQTEPGLLEMLLSADDFNEFITALQYTDAIHDHNTAQVRSLQDMYDNLAQTRAMLTAELDAATQKQDEALRALDSIRSSLADLQRRTTAERPTGTADNANTTAAAEALQEAKNIVSTLPPAVANAVTQATESTPQDTPAATTEQDITPAEPEPANAQGASADDGSLASRIDAYLSSYGAPLAGYGADIVQAASEYGVDPRLPAAIAVIESGGGKVCFLPHNAWGWGSQSWSDWPSAVRGYTSGFASIYGYDLSLEEAEAYASNDIYETWYNLVLSEMASI